MIVKVDKIKIDLADKQIREYLGDSKRNIQWEDEFLTGNHF